MYTNKKCISPCVFKCFLAESIAPKIGKRCMELVEAVPGTIAMYKLYLKKSN